MKRSLRVIGILLLGLVFIVLITLDLVDRTPYQEMAYYQSTMDRLANLPSPEAVSNEDTLRGNWAKVLLLPPEPVPLAGYGNRRGVYEGVRDTLWVRAFVFDNGLQRVALVTADLLIIPPEVSAQLQVRRSDGSISFDDIYLTATHSHSSIGAWNPGIVGNIFAGSFDQVTVDFIADRIGEAINLASEDLEPLEIGFGRQMTEGLTYNRLAREEGSIDPWFRFLVLERKTERAVIGVFSAHPTCLPRLYKNVSRDYPGIFVELMESDSTVDFAAFAAGGVGSHGAGGQGDTGEARMEYIGSSLAELALDGIDSVKLRPMTKLNSTKLMLDLRDSQLRVSEDVRLRPWVFKSVFGDYPVTLNTLRLGEILFAGAPSDFSGELIPPLEKLSAQNGMQLFVTSFNGGYIGYITKDEWYDRDHYETRIMNWYGPYNGAYLSEVMSGLINYNSATN